jgi:Domain of unknown function (DUF4158)
MQQDWHPDELAQHWTLSPDEHELLGHKTGATRLRFAVRLKAFPYDGRFPVRSALAAMKDGASAVNVERVLDETAKLTQLRALGLPEGGVPRCTGHARDAAPAARGARATA